MEKVKVLHLVSSLWSGGVAVLLKNYYEHMDKNLIRFDFVVHSPVKGVTEEYFESVGSQIYRLPPMKNFCASFIGTYRIIKQNDYRIVHAHHTDVSFVQLFAAKCAGAKIRIAHSHDELFPKRLKEKIKRKLYCILTTMLSNYHFACSESAGRYVFGEQVNFSNYLYVHNAIDYEKFKFDQRKREEFRNKLGWNDCFVIGNVGRLVDQKNPFFTIEIFAKTLKKIPNARLLLIGKGDLLESINSRLKELEIDKYVKVIEVTTQVENYMFAMDVFLFPSRHEGLGIALIEAQASGLPCVVSNVIPNEAYVNSSYIDILSLDESPTKWAEVLCKYNNPKRVVDFSQKLIDNYSIPKEANKLQDWYIDKWNTLI